MSYDSVLSIIHFLDDSDTGTRGVTVTLFLHTKFGGDVLKPVHITVQSIEGGCFGSVWRQKRLMRICSGLTLMSRFGEGDAKATERNLAEVGNNIPPK